MINSGTPYLRFIESLRYYLPGCKINEYSQDEEKTEIRRCLKYLKTFKITIFIKKNQSVELCGMTRLGYFILNGKPYIWPWRETKCPNWIYKLKDGVEGWFAPCDRPWELYQGRLKLILHQNTLCIEGKYDKGYRSLQQCIDDKIIDDPSLYLDEETKEKYSAIMGKWKNKKNILENHQVFPNLVSKSHRTIFISFMIRSYFSSEKTDLNDISTKRLISVEWLIGHLCQDITNSKNMIYMKRRIYSNGQLVNLNSYFEYISQVTRVIRGKATHGKTETRELHMSHRGVYCPYRASEGENIGLAVDLVPEVTISIVNSKMNIDEKYIEDKLVNGCLISEFTNDIGKIKKISVNPKDWIWTDSGIIKPGNVEAIGCVAQQIIFPRHMPPVRCMYATTHLRQAVHLTYPQRPLIISSTQKISIINGCNLIVAVCGFHGWNIEDALVINGSFIERGGLQSTLKKNIVLKRSNDENWKGKLLEKGSMLTKDKIAIGKEKNGKDTSLKGIEGVVVSCHRTEDDLMTVMQVETVHRVEIGDKLSSRSGQKGVIGYISEPENMPYTEDGIIPDLIINPAHLPSRMTVSQMLESYFGRLCLEECELGIDMECLSNDEVIKLRGNKLAGKEKLICGRTGRYLGNAVFIGPVYYMALHHMVHKKCRARDKGPNIKITGQPTKGGNSQGGLRIGEMERDQILSKGCTEILRDRLVDMSDRMRVTVCKNCGWLEPEIECCEYQTKVNITMSRTTRLVLMEMYGMGIFPRLDIDNKRKKQQLKEKYNVDTDIESDFDSDDEFFEELSELNSLEIE